METPSNLNDFLLLLNPTNLKVFNKLEIFKIGLRISRQTCQEIEHSIQNRLSYGLANNPHDLGVFALRVFFFQILKGGIFSLDLRPSQFDYRDNWNFKGKNLAFKFRDETLSALGDTYRKYYSGTDEDIISELSRMGITSPHWTQEEKVALQESFLRTFKRENNEKQTFKLTDLLSSFEGIFSQIKAHGGTVPSEIAILGVYLTSLYLNLQKIEVGINVRDCFFHSLELHKELTGTVKQENKELP